MPLPPRLRRRAAIAVVALVLGTVLASLVLAGCSGGDSGTSSSADSGGGSSGGSADGSSGGAALGRPETAPDARSSDTAGRATDESKTARDRTDARVLPTDRDIIYRGAIEVKVKDLTRAVARAESLALDVDGVVFSEQTTADPSHPKAGNATLTLRVPPTQFAATLDALGRLGKELSRNRSAEDVTTEVADVDSRVRTQERSVERVRALLAKANTIGEVVSIESELSRREADLESLQAQLARLQDVTDLATIDVSLYSPRPGVQPVPEPDENLGFLSGLRGGWDAFVAIVLVALTVLGAVVPFVVTAALLGLPAYAVLRNRRRRGPTTTPAA